MRGIALLLNDLVISFTLLLAIYLPYKQEKEIEEFKFNEVTLVSLYQREGIKFPNIVYWQSYLETAKFSSNICKENFNMFGMKHNKRGYSKGVNRGHALYENYILSIKDYSQWQKKMMNAHEVYFKKKIVTEEDYFFFLEHIVIGKNVYRYAEDLNYINKLKSLKSLQ